MERHIRHLVNISEKSSTYPLNEFSLLVVGVGLFDDGLDVDAQLLDRLGVVILVRFRFRIVIVVRLHLLFDNLRGFLQIKYSPLSQPFDSFDFMQTSQFEKVIFAKMDV